MPREIVLPYPRVDQFSVLDDDHRFKILLCGRRWGKDVTGILAALLGHGPRDENGKPTKYKGALFGADIWYVGLTFGQAGVIWRAIKNATKGCWLSKSEKDKRITFPGGGSIQVKSAQDEDNLRGSGLDGIVSTEAAFWRKGVWSNALRASLSDRKGWAFFLTTPPEEQNWFTELYDAVIETNEQAANPAWATWQRPSSDNPLIDEQELADATRDLTADEFGREYLAELLYREGSIIKRWMMEPSWDTLPTFKRVVLSLDTSLKSGITNDYSALSAWGVTDDEWYYGLDFWRGKVPTTQLKQRVWDFYLRWNPDYVLIEDTARGSELIAEVQRGEGQLARLPVKAVTPRNKKGAKRLAVELVEPLWDRLRVLLPKRHPEVAAFKAEVLAFPKSKEDDYTDTMSQALGFLKVPARVARGRKAA